VVHIKIDHKNNFTQELVSFLKDLTSVHTLIFDLMPTQNSNFLRKYNKNDFEAFFDILENSLHCLKKVTFPFIIKDY
jgi:hypothetical protein